jgi:hypothetical protein
MLAIDRRWEKLAKLGQLANLAYDNTKYKVIRNSMFLTTPLTTWRDHFRTNTSHEFFQSWALIGHSFSLRR